MICVNDKFEVDWEEGMTVALLLKRLKFSFPLIIVSVDGVLVPQGEYATRRIPEDAQVKVLHMSAGG
jgi:thiamine biosynthesis protein ThiS